MNETRNPDPAATADDDDGLEPREAARLLDQARRDARRQFNLNPPLAAVIRAVVILAGYGALWLSVRGQQPYQGPSPAALAAMYAAVGVTIALTARIIQHATAGVSGNSKRQMTAELIAIVAAFTAAGVFQGALLYNGASRAIVYGVFPAAGQLLVAGSCWAGSAASRQHWPGFAAALAIVAVGTGAAFAGPVDAWAVAGVGLFLIVLCGAAASAWQQRSVPVSA